MACKMELNDGNNYQGIILAILTNLVMFWNLLQLSSTWSNQAKGNIKVYE